MMRPGILKNQGVVMKILAIVLLFTTVPGTQLSWASTLSPEDLAFENQFKEYSKLGVTLNHLPSPESPWGSPNPDAAPELQQFAFMVGRHDCIQPLTGINPNNPEQVLENDMVWLAYYALNGRAIRDEFYSMGGNGEQTRAYDTFAEEWWVTWATVPGPVSLVPEPKPNRGTFSASQVDEDMVMKAPPSTDQEGQEFVTTITFFGISDDGFEWKSENVYEDKLIQTASMSCKKVAGPDI